MRQICEIKYGANNIDTLTIGDTSVSRDWSHVDDICAGYILMAEKGHAGRVYVQGSGKAVTVQTFLDTATQIIKPDDVKIARTVKARPAEIPYLRADTSRIKTELGWAPKKGLIDIIFDLWDYYKVAANRENLMV